MVYIWSTSLRNRNTPTHCSHQGYTRYKEDTSGWNLSFREFLKMRTHILDFINFYLRQFQSHQWEKGCPSRRAVVVLEKTTTALCGLGKPPPEYWGSGLWASPWKVTDSIRRSEKDSQGKASQHHEANRANEFPCWLSGKESACHAEDAGLIPGLGRSPGEGNGNPCQYSPLGNPMDSGTWWATVHGGHKESDMT